MRGARARPRPSFSLGFPLPTPWLPHCVPADRPVGPCMQTAPLPSACPQADMWGPVRAPPAACRCLRAMAACARCPREPHCGIAGSGSSEARRRAAGACGTVRSPTLVRRRKAHGLGLEGCRLLDCAGAGCETLGGKPAMGMA